MQIPYERKSVNRRIALSMLVSDIHRPKPVEDMTTSSRMNPNLLNSI
jgi:hypothetical protein